jgi:anti-sigma factor RsiW
MMSETFTCGDHGALVSYLYDECTPAERRTIAAHLVICGACAEEIVALSATREQLATWTPPDAQLGFTVSAATSKSHVLRPRRWWQKSMPGWAQAAAAVFIFGTGLTLGALRGVSQPAIAHCSGRPRARLVPPVRERSK